MRDVPHPLSPAGLDAYDFAITDSLRDRLPGAHASRSTRSRCARRTIASRASSARCTSIATTRRSCAWRSTSRARRFSTTRWRTCSSSSRTASSTDASGSRASRRSRSAAAGTWLDYPIRGIIRGRWVIGDYQFNIGFSPAMFGGPEIVHAPKADAATRVHFGGRILDSLPPDVRAVTDADIQRVQDEARALVRAQALRRPQALDAVGASASPTSRASTASKDSPSAPVWRRASAEASASKLRGRYGVDDKLGKGSGTLSWRSPQWGVRGCSVASDFRDAGDIQERSIVVTRSRRRSSGRTTPIRTACTPSASASTRSA